MLVKVWVAHDLYEFLSSFVAPGHHGGPDEVRRAKGEHVLRCESATCDIAAAQSKGEIEDFGVQLCRQLAEWCLRCRPAEWHLADTNVRHLWRLLGLEWLVERDSICVCAVGSAPLSLEDTRFCRVDRLVFVVGWQTNRLACQHDDESNRTAGLPPFCRRCYLMSTLTSSPKDEQRTGTGRGTFIQHIASAYETQPAYITK